MKPQGRLWLFPKKNSAKPSMYPSTSVNKPMKRIANGFPPSSLPYPKLKHTLLIGWKNIQMEYSLIIFHNYLNRI